MKFLSILWGIPFVGIILSMSLLPLISPNFWKKYRIYVPLFWTSIYAACVCLEFGIPQAITSILNAFFSEYISFIIQIATLFIVSGGIFINLARQSTPTFNTIFLFGSSLLAGWIGTTGAASLLIRPILRANNHRYYRVHIMVFFIFLVANIGGALTPLGDPPLFVGFTNGIDFFWFMKNLYPYIFGTLSFLCVIFWLLDTQLLKIERRIEFENDIPIERDIPKEFTVKGKFNIVLLALVLLTVIFCDFEGQFSFIGNKFRWSSVVRNIILIMIGITSLKYTNKTVRERNNFSLTPIKEVAELFAGIFVTITPIIDILHQGANGSLSWLFNELTQNGELVVKKCFWIGGLLSSILDNTPMFLIFFHLASGDAQSLMTTNAHVLTAFSIATVFMGSLTYIGNAPNLIVKSIASSYGVKTPSFLEYMLWSIGILIPVFVVISYYL